MVSTRDHWHDPRSSGDFHFLREYIRVGSPNNNKDLKLNVHRFVGFKEQDITVIIFQLGISNVCFID